MAAATFTYKAVDASGLPSTGEIVGATKEAVVDELKRLMGGSISGPAIGTMGPAMGGMGSDVRAPMGAPPSTGRDY